MILPPVEQYLISKEKRLFKGFEDYNQVTRLVFDLETTSLEPKDGRIFMIGQLAKLAAVGAGGAGLMAGPVKLASMTGQKKLDAKRISPLFDK